MLVPGPVMSKAVLAFACPSWQRTFAATQKPWTLGSIRTFAAAIKTHSFSAASTSYQSIAKQPWFLHTPQHHRAP